MSETQHSKDCVLFATADWDTPYWTNKQHTARHLAQLGYRVLYIESVGLRAPTLSGRDLRRIWQRIKRGMRAPEQVEPRLWVMSPLAIPVKHHWRIMRALNQGLLSLRIKRFMQRHGFTAPLIWTYHPFMLDTIDGLDHGALVYHCVDDLSAIPGIDPVAFNAEEQRLLGQCQAVFVTSDSLKEKCLPLNANTHYFSNVVDVEHFGKAHEIGRLPDDLASISSPRIGYIGALSDFKVDFELIHVVAKARPDWSWVLIGAEREGQKNPIVEALTTLPNVHFLGDKQYSSLPDYLREIDVGTLPTLINEYTRSMFPMKYFEYLAAGVPVVSTNLEFTKKYKSGLKIVDSPATFILSVEYQLKRGRFTRDEARQLVGENTWSERTKKMLRKLLENTDA